MSAETNPKVIYLAPACHEEHMQREWCEDDVWPACEECGSKNSSVRYNLGVDFDRVTAERDALQQRLTAADERADTAELNLSIESAKLDQARATNKRVVALQDLLTHAHIAIHAMEPGFFLLEKIDAELKQTEASSYACTWQYGAFSWHTACGQEWMLNDGTPEQNGMHFCHSCGKTLVVDEDQPESERES